MSKAEAIAITSIKSQSLEDEPTEEPQQSGKSLSKILVMFWKLAVPQEERILRNGHDSVCQSFLAASVAHILISSAVDDCGIESASQLSESSSRLR